MVSSGKLWDKILLSAGLTTPGDISGVSHLPHFARSKSLAVFPPQPRSSHQICPTVYHQHGWKRRLAAVLVSGVSTGFIYTLGIHVPQCEKPGLGAASSSWLLHLLARDPKGFQPPTTIFYIQVSVCLNYKASKRFSRF